LKIIGITYFTGSLDSAVGIATSYGLGGRGKIFLSNPEGTDRLWGPPSLQSSGYRGYIPWGEAAGRETIIRLRLVPRSIMVELYLHSTTLLQSVMLN
jgi:hypothetical protein